MVNENIKSTSKYKVSRLTKIAMLSGISFILFLVDFSVPFFPPFLQLDLSDLPALIGSFAMGPIVGVAIELFKNLIHLTMTSTGGVGELANFVIGSSLVLPAGLIYKYRKNVKFVVIALVVGIVSMVVAGSLMNYFVLIPLYSTFMPMDTIINISNKVNSLIVDKTTLVLYGIAPFNLLKASVVSLVTIAIYKKISYLLK